MKIEKMLCPAGLKNNPNRALREITFITVHCTGNYRATAGAYNHAKFQVGGSGGTTTSWHYSVDAVSIWQSFEDSRECWHTGNAIGNSKSIGVEICVNDKDTFLSSCNRAAWLVASLIRRHNMNIDCVVQHNHWSGKNCPSELRSGVWGIDWREFIDLVKKYIEISAPIA